MVYSVVVGLPDVDPDRLEDHAISVGSPLDGDGRDGHGITRAVQGTALIHTSAGARGVLDT